MLQNLTLIQKYITVLKGKRFQHYSGFILVEPNRCKAELTLTQSNLLAFFTIKAPQACEQIRFQCVRLQLIKNLLYEPFGC